MIDLCGTGLVCSVGLSAPAACAAMRAGIVRYHELPYWDRDNLPVVGSYIPGLSLDLQFGPRLVEMLVLALRDCLSRTTESLLHRVPILIGLAEPERPGAGGLRDENLLSQVQDKLGRRFHPNLSKVIATGHTAGFACLRMAQELLLSTDIPGCLVCGADSYINASSLYWLDEHWRLKRENNSDGVVPGEAAAVVYVRRHAVHRSEARAEVVGIGFGREPAPLLSEAPLLGLGLAEAARNALAGPGWGFHELDFRVSDVTGENYGFREHTLTMARLSRVVRTASQPLWHPAESIGDTGAAAGVVQLALVAAAFARNYAPGSQAACFTSSLMGERAVVALQRPTGRY